ncbi:Hypothetical predicted protein [Paramuricea clavata]|uniref:Uncharacterized protein n=1 Tax=Paramuricea clavata TaxID=317549 RepID=A0A7D9KQP2_PARCT|nr:Hypothetical predicted protein [Paramuricea clavata]
MKFKKKQKVQVIENHIAAQQLLNVTGINAATIFQNSKLRLLNRMQMRSLMVMTAVTKKCLVAAIEDEKSEDFDDNEYDESQIKVDVNEHDDKIGNVVHVTRSGMSVSS